MYVFFFKQKTAYEMRIGVWSSDVCSSDLLMKLFLNALEREVVELHRRCARVRFIGERERFGAQIRERMQAAEAQTAGNERLALNIAAKIGRASSREKGWQ